MLLPFWFAVEEMKLVQLFSVVHCCFKLVKVFIYITNTLDDINPYWPRTTVVLPCFKLTTFEVFLYLLFMISYTLLKSIIFFYKLLFLTVYNVTFS